MIEDNPEELAILLEEEGAQLSASDWPLYMPALNGPTRMELVRDGIRSRGHSAAVVDKIMSGNLYRLYSEVIG